MNKRLGTLLAALSLVAVAEIGNAASPAPQPGPCFNVRRQCIPAPRTCGGAGERPCPSPRRIGGTSGTSSIGR